MKQIFYILLVLLPLIGVSQNKNTTIKVSGRAVHVDASPTYKATLSLSPAYSTYGADSMSLDELKSHYKETLESNGILWSEIKETPYEFGFETMGYDKAGSVYEFTTTSIEKMRAFLRIKSLGLQRLNIVAVQEIDAEELKKLYEVALKDAKAKAIAIASALDKKIVRILTIEDNQYVGQKVETSIFYDRPVGEYIYGLQVIFETKE